MVVLVLVPLKGEVGVVGETPLGADCALLERDLWAREEESEDAADSGRGAFDGRAVVGVGGSGSGSRDSSAMSMFQIRTVWSAEQVARSLMSGESRRRVRYVLCALKTRQGWRVVES